MEQSGLCVYAFMESSSRDCLIYGIYVLVLMFQLNVVDSNVNIKGFQIAANAVWQNVAMAMEQDQSVFGEVLKMFLWAYQMTRVLCKFFTLSCMVHLSIYVDKSSLLLKYYHRFRILRFYSI